MPFKSEAQSRAAFSGALGPKMKKAAKEWASKTDYKNLPNKVSNKGDKMFPEQGAKLNTVIGNHPHGKSKAKADSRFLKNIPKDRREHYESGDGYDSREEGKVKSNNY
jgi:hypothetical protein